MKKKIYKKMEIKDIERFLMESSAIEGDYSPQGFENQKKAWEYIKNRGKLNISILLKSHKILSKNSKLLWKEKGFFRKCKVWVGGREGVDWGKVPKKVKQLINNINDIIQNGKNEDVDSLERLIQFQHVTFEKIHPFVDFNGRTGRLILLWSYFRLKLPIKIIFEEDRQEYYSWFKD